MPKPYSEDDERNAQSKKPMVICAYKFINLRFDTNMTDDEMRQLAEDAILIRKEFADWENFQTELEQRKRRSLGFRAAVLALDLQQAAVAMGTTPQKIKVVMDAYAAAEETRLAELQELWDAGTLPDRDVLGDPSKELLK